MSEKLSYEKLSKIAANQTVTIRQQNEILENQRTELRNAKMGLEMERMRFDESKHAAIHHQVNQCVDFAIRSLPWWKRSTRTVVDRASEYLLTIKHEAGKHVAMDVLTQRLEDEADNEKIDATVNTVSVNQNCDTEIHATMDREGAELEQV